MSIKTEWEFPSHNQEQPKRRNVTYQVKEDGAGAPKGPMRP